MSEKLHFDARNHADNVSDRKMPCLPYLDTGPLDDAMAALRKSFPHLNTPDAVVMNRWEDYRKQAKSQFLQGFDDGYFGNLSAEPKMTEAYSQGYNDGYALAQMHDANSDKEEGYDDDCIQAIKR